MAFVEAEGGWNKELLFNGYTVWVDREVLENHCTLGMLAQPCKGTQCH